MLQEFEEAKKKGFVKQEKISDELVQFINAVKTNDEKRVEDILSKNPTLVNQTEGCKHLNTQRLIHK